MALGSNYSERSRKTDLIMRIQIKRNINGMSVKEATASVQGYRQKTVAELNEISKSESKPKISDSFTKEILPSPIECEMCGEKHCVIWWREGEPFCRDCTEAIITIDGGSAK